MWHITKLLFATLFVASCSGSTGDPAGGSVGSQGSSIHTLPGKIVTYEDQDDRMWQFDFASGKFSPYESAPLKERTPIIEPGADVDIFPTPGFTGIVYTIQDCIATDDFSLYHDSCVIVQDESEKDYTSFRFPGDVGGYAKLSPNGKHIIVQRDLGLGYSEYRLYEANVGFLAEKFTSLELPRSISHVEHDWGQNGELYYSIKELDEASPSITVTQPDSLVTDREISFPAAFSNYTIFYLDLSNDGKKLLLGFREKGSSVDGIITYVLMLENMELYQPVLDIDTINGASSYNSIYDAQWSPDDNWIMFSYGGTSGTTITSVHARAANLLVIPSSSRGLVLNADDPLIAPGVIKLVFNDIDIDNLGNDDFSELWLGEEPRWVP